MARQRKYWGTKVRVQRSGAYREGLKVDPNNAMLKEGLEEVMARQRKYWGTEVRVQRSGAYREGLKVDPNNAMLKEGLEEVMARQRKYWGTEVKVQRSGPYRVDPMFNGHDQVVYRGQGTKVRAL